MTWGRGGSLGISRSSCEEDERGSGNGLQQRSFGFAVSDDGPRRAGETVSEESGRARSITRPYDGL